MKIMLRKDGAGQLSVYVPKKDLEEPIVSMEKPEMWGGIVTLGNGWQLELPPATPGTDLPCTVEARKLNDD
ncbi:putative nitrogen fixation protein NifT [Beijerinckia mobilis]|uniref:putative nitrogen fixation protein NifT n=1 Tax=Beijerinckia mobilis TaxID=231434 RepID=UPI000552E83D|nr:putative nitrogen fixation protein NifT [Beijerinckia mobilis]